MATIRAGVVSQGATAAAALSDNAQRMARVLAAVKRAGIADRDIQTATVQLQPQYRYGDNVPPAITGYQATNTISVRFRDVAKSGSVLDALVAQGANQIDGPICRSTSRRRTGRSTNRRDPARPRPRRTLCEGGGPARRADRVDLREWRGCGGPQPPIMFRASAMRSDAMEKTSIAPGERDVTVNVSVRFLLN